LTPRLSIITPSLNQGAFIERTIRSVLDQQCADLEYIVVDGGSTDESVEIIKRYADHLAWWISEPDSGQTDALNKGLRRATGDVVAYINSDDYYLPGAFAAALDGLAASGAAWVAGACRFVGPSGEFDSVWRPEPPGPRRHGWLTGPWGVPQAATFWKRGVFDRHGLFREDMHYAFDTEYGLRLLFAGERPELVEDELAVRVLHPEAKSWDRSAWRAEELRFDEIYGARLTTAERILLKAGRILQRITDRTKRG
jgi:glycosyltransferase involved in cell wall biosynthesis